MKSMLRFLAIGLLVFNALGALYGGTLLMIDPSGTTIGLSPHWIANTVFSDYLIPGLVLLVTQGILSSLIAAASFMRVKHYTSLITFQGVVLTGWIVVQMLIMQMTYFLHYIMGGTGLMLTLVGFWLAKLELSQK